MCDKPLFVCKESFNDGWDNNWGSGDHMLQGYWYHRQQEKSGTYVSLDKQPHVFYHSHSVCVPIHDAHDYSQV
jgi:hypothetical protein